MDDEALMEKVMNTPWQLMLREATLFMEQTEAESIVVGMRFQSGKTLRVKVAIAEPDAQE